MMSDSFDAILDDLAGKLLELFGLVRCEITTDRGSGRALVPSNDSEGPTATIPLATPAGPVGFVNVARGAEGEFFSASELELLGTVAGQTALAIERAALDQQVRAVTLDAEASAMRAALFSSVTHDLKTPLASIKASATGLLTEGTSYTKEQRGDIARTIIEATDHLNQIVANLLELARMRTGVLIPNKQEVLIEDVIASAIRHMKRSLEPFTIELKVRSDLPPVDADPVQLEQVFSNLLENAMRFSSHGTEIQISAVRWHDVVQTRVTDHGVGVPAADRERIFEEFFSRGAGKVRAGTGLGLAIARAVVVGHGGKIWATEAPGGGTSIVFELPLTKVETDSTTAEPPQMIPS
jgi:two-component system sensor histidine kinase KdpD